MSTSAEFQVGISPGDDGLAVRKGSLALFVMGPYGGSAAVVEAVGRLDSHLSASSLTEMLFSVLKGDSVRRMSFGLAAQVGDGILLAVRGAVSAELQFPGRDTRTLRGDRALTWVDELITDEIGSIAMQTHGQSRVPTHPLSRLVEGVVPCSGIEIATVPMSFHDSSATAMKPTADSLRPQRVVELRSASEVAGASEKLTPQLHDETMVASSPGGVLVSAQGSQWALDRDYVIGRDPAIHSDVQSGAASPIEITGDQYVSRAHAHLASAGPIVTITDLSTPGGTYVARPGDKEWTSVTQPTLLEEGWSIRVGSHIFTLGPG